ncbi:hypothetical protein AGMMS49579_14350 [Spirochaetia bacterium]|nr:hypothetical protein AGMMS49579_14350 [Spirochaetia bacterium]
MEAVFGLALKGHTGAVHLRKAVGIVHVDFEEFFDAAAGVLGIGFCPGKGFP